VEDHPGVCSLTTGHCEYDLSPDTDTWVLLTPGTFEMGPAENEIDTDASREDPRHEVTLTRPFLMRTTEITMREWAAVGGDAPGWSSRPENPKQFATWWDVLAWCNLLSEAEGLETCYELTNCTGEPFVHPGGEPMCGACFECDVPPPLDLDCPGYRLPTEAEWEYACRSGSPTELYTGEVWGGERCNAPEIEPLAWYLSNTYYGGGVLLPCGTCPPSGMYLYCSSMPVGLKQPSPWGLYDMLGNAPEFVNDVWGAYPDGPVVDPVEPAGKWEGPWGPNAVGRGGGFGRDAHFTRCTQRLSSNSLRWSSGGLRPVRTLP
jgi:formylglycine-generating enzyme required for sulfatase activity